MSKPSRKPVLVQVATTPRASIAVGIIAKNAEKTIGACLDSIVPYVAEVVVCVDAATTDRTAIIAKKKGARVIKGLHVSQEHTCPMHGTVMVPHFADARNVCWSHLRKDVDWHMWIDSDDIVQGGEKLPALMAQLGPEMHGVWLAYHYSQAGKGGPTATLFHRERIVRANMPWEWQYRVHEVLAPVGRPIESLNWAQLNEVSVVHQGEGHDTEGSARRNILCLEIDLEENPNDERALFYMGNQYFALNEWEVANHFYLQSVNAPNTYQVWQTWLYVSMSYEKMGMLGDSQAAAYHAMDAAPYHPEPYYRLAALAMLAGDGQRCEFWTRLGDERVDAPFFAFKNPLDRTFNSKITLAAAYGNAGHVSKAKHELMKAASVIAQPDIIAGIQEYAKQEQETLDAEAFMRVMEKLPEEQREFMAIPDDVWKFGRVRDLVVPRMLKGRPNSQPRIVFWCGRSIEPWAPPSLNTTGIGGSETAVIQIAKRFAADGWLVDVYNEPDRFEGEYDGVGYWGLGRLGAGEKASAFVSWRNPAAAELPLERRVSLLWCHDLNSGPSARDAFQSWDRVLGVSRWHADYLSNVYGLACADFVPNGIELSRFSGDVDKIPGRCVYASSQDRGLERLLRIWPDVRAVVPNAELHIAYGWENFDKYIQMGNMEIANTKATILSLLEQPGVVWRGRLPQDELARLHQESEAWLYPTSFLEVSCITAMEAMAGGCVPVTSAAGALPETIGDAGMVVSGNTYSQSWKEFWALCAIAVLSTPEQREPLLAKGKERVRGLSWDDSYRGHWRPIVSRLLEKQEVVA